MLPVVKVKLLCKRAQEAQDDQHLLSAQLEFNKALLLSLKHKH